MEEEVQELNSLDSSDVQELTLEELRTLSGNLSSTNIAEVFRTIHNSGLGIMTEGGAQSGNTVESRVFNPSSWAEDNREAEEDDEVELEVINESGEDTMTVEEEFDIMVKEFDHRVSEEERIKREAEELKLKKEEELKLLEVNRKKFQKEKIEEITEILDR